MHPRNRSGLQCQISIAYLRLEKYILQLDRCVYQRLAKEDVCSIDQVEARR